MEDKRLQRNMSEKVIGGVCAGLADYFGLDPVLVRVVFVVLALAGGPGLLLYLILWVVMPPDEAPPAA